MTTDDKNNNSQFALLGQRRFYPLFWTQFGGAFNDNFYKSALMMLFTYDSVERWGLSVDVLNNLVAAALIIPFLLFAPIAGQYADRLDKAAFARAIKVAEIVIMMLGALAIWLGSSALLLLVIFGTGIQSACFSPIKYAILPQHVAPRELVGANGVLHTGTSLAVFLGLIAGTLALQFTGGQYVVAIGGFLVAWAGWRLSRRIPPAPPSPLVPELVRNPFKQTLRTLAYARERHLVFWTVIGLSWYWFLGSVYLTQLPNFTRAVLSGAASAVTCLLVAFLLGVCAGALLCEKISRRLVEPAVVPLGALLIALLGADLAFAGQGFAAAHPPRAEGELYTLIQLLALPEFWRIALDVLLLGVAGGLYSVPLQALMQQEAKSEHRAQIIAANNVFNALFMIGASVAAVICLGQLDFTIPHFFMLTTALHSFIMIVLFLREPIFLSRVRQRFSRSAG